ncbi:MAG TPA: TRAM domain-containing protein [Acidimicrobiales bacterium]
MIELVAGPIAAGGGCVARADDGRVVFVRHALPGERVLAQVMAETSSFLRADAIDILEPSADRVEPPCPHAGPGRCGGCDWQHVSLTAQRALKSALIAEQLRRLAGLDWQVEVEVVEGAPDGLGWRTRVNFAVDRSGRTGLRKHRSHDVEPVEWCPIATDRVNRVGVGSALWRGARNVEVTASPNGGKPVVAVETGHHRLAGRPGIDAGLVVNGRTLRRPDQVFFEVLGRRFEVGAGVFWQVHPGAATVLTDTVLEALGPVGGERVVDLYAGAVLFTVALAHEVGPSGSVLAVERQGRACVNLMHNAADLHQVEIEQADVTPGLVAGRLGSPDLVVLDPARAGAGLAVMGALAAVRPSPRRIAYVSCEPAPFARDLRVMLDAGWTLGSLRAFDAFPMTEHVELVGTLEPPGRS